MLCFILAYLPYQRIANLRNVSVKFDSACKVMLNRGFKIVKNEVNKCVTKVKAMIPDGRPEELRKRDQLTNRFDILCDLEETVELLGNFYDEYIDKGWCCFIPGQMIDEMLHVLRRIMEDESQPVSYCILFNIHEMSEKATNHFLDKVLSQMLQSNCYELDLDTSSSSSSSPSSNRSHLTRIKQLESEVETFRTALEEEKVKTAAMEKKIWEQDKLIEMLQGSQDDIGGKRRRSSEF